MIVDFGTCLHSAPTSREVPAEVAPGPVQGGIRVPVQDGATIMVGGAAWLAQAGRLDGITREIGTGLLTFRAKAGEHASFDSPRVIRAELCGARRFERGEEIYLRGIINVDRSTVIRGADWFCVMQIHQADTRRSDGTFVVGSPLFAVRLVQEPGGEPRLRVVGETSLGVPGAGVFAPGRILGDVPFTFGVDHRIEFRVVDGHGGPGRIVVKLDDETVVDRSDLQTGYEYVDLLADALEPRQSTGSYMKIGIYAGGAYPELFTAALSLRGLSTDPSGR